MDMQSHGVDVYKWPIGPMRDECLSCGKTSGMLSRCGGCMIARYCCREHQVSHRPVHKTLCLLVKKMRADVAKEEHKVRNATEDWLTPANAFATDVGRFWGLHGTRPYMRARMELAQSLRLLGTRDSVSEAHDHMVDMLRLCHNDNLGIRDIVPETMLRLDRDQEAYDFIRWWSTHDDGNGVWEFHGADVWEAPDFDFSLPPLSHYAVTLLLKLKLLVDIRNLKIARKLRGTHALPPEIWDCIEQEVVRSPLALPLRRKSYAELLKLDDLLCGHCGKLGTRIAGYNKEFFRVLFDPEEALDSSPALHSMGSWEEAAITVQYVCNSWCGTEGVYELVWDAYKLSAGKGDMGDGAKMWSRLSDAIANAAYLGPDKTRRPKPLPKRIRE